MTITRRASLAISAVAAWALATGPSWAQEWPAKQPIRIVVPYPAGGNADSAARAAAEVVAANLKQVIVVDNRPGASSVIGTEVVARAPADGYTLGVVSDSHAINQAIGKLPKGNDLLGAKVAYDAVRDFVPVSGLIQIPLVLVVHPSVSARNVKDLVQLTRANKDKGVAFGSMGPGSPWFVHMHQLNKLTGGDFMDVPYKGLAPAATDLLGGQIQTMLMPVHFAQQYISSGKLVPLATLGAKRHPLLPNVPTLAESGYPGLDIANYLIFVAPAGTPQPIVERLSRELNAALKQPAMKDKLALMRNKTFRNAKRSPAQRFSANAGRRQGPGMLSGDPYPAEPAELAARLRRDIDAYGAVIQATVK